jgi:hypothetical protein
VASIDTDLNQKTEAFKAQVDGLKALKALAPWWRSGSGGLACISWLNFFSLFWVVLFDLLPEQVSGSFVGLAALIFFLLAMGASMLAYQGGGK